MARAGLVGAGVIRHGQRARYRSYASLLVGRVPSGPCMPSRPAPPGQHHLACRVCCDLRSRSAIMLLAGVTQRCRFSAQHLACHIDGLQREV